MRRKLSQSVRTGSRAFFSASIDMIGYAFRAMNYLCGKDCPSGDKCTNGSLATRPQKEIKIFWVRAKSCSESE